MNIQIVLAGVGGQGILFAARIFSQLGLKLGLDVMGSETHGMSQRGGSVVAHLKLGAYLSPLVRSGTADILFSFEKKEAYKNLKFLRRGGLCFVNLSSADQFDDKILHHLKNKNITFKAYDATGVALKMESIRSANIALIGYSAGTGLLPFNPGDLKGILKSFSQKNNIESNLKAFEAGFRFSQQEATAD
jgi:indolepyruvate ferredoxin oxidoreductase beta subunit